MGRRKRLAILAGLLPLTACVSDQTPSAFRGAGRIAAEINTLTYVLLGLGGLAFVVTFGVLAYGLWGSRREGNLERVIVIGGLLFPMVLLSITYAVNLETLRDIVLPEPDPLVIDVVGNQYWWQVSYPAYNFETANEIHVPVDTPIELRLRSNDVVHAFWLPELGVKRDLIPGQVNTYQFEAAAARRYWGLCSEFCGIQHANMLMVVVSHEPEEFEAWVARQQQPAPAPATEETERGWQVFVDAECIDCHAIRGTGAVGNAGPDLTHLAGRLTLGAGAVENDVGHLAGWIANPHGIKPGVNMPASDISGAELQALLAYLQTLE